MPAHEDSPNLPEVRASDADRERAYALLKEACLDGRLSLDEYTQRVDQVEGARTQLQLLETTRDLQAAPAGDAPSSPPTVAIMSDITRGGRWRVGEKTTAIAVMGACKLDLRGAIISAPVTTIRARVVMGSLDVFVPEGVEVQLETTTIMGSQEVKLKDPLPPPGRPVIRITGLALMGSVTVRGSR